MKYASWFCCLFVAALSAAPAKVFAQEPEQTIKSQPPADRDTAKLVEILPGARKLEFRNIDDSTQLQILAGNVSLRQGKTLFYCDSCIINNRLGIFDAFGKVHINDADTAHTYSDFLRYNMNSKIAWLRGNVRLTDGKGTLTTPELEYDVNTNIGIYTNNGRVVNNKTVLTSREGYYYTGPKDVYFKKNVELKDSAYYLKTDSLLYNTETETARFIAWTFIKDSSGRTIETSEGYYNLKTGKAEFGKRPVVHDGKRTIRADRITIDDSTGISRAEGNVVIEDSAQNTTVIAGRVFRNAKKETMLATQKPLLIMKQDNDSVFITADTLFSARLTDLQSAKDSVVKDTLKGVTVINTGTTDSTNRYFEAYRNVRIFSDSLQGVCDSMFYSFRDSVFRLYDNPVIWSNKSQASGDTILLFTKNKKADRFRIWENSFLVNQLDPEIFNQVQSTWMEGFFSDGEIDSVKAKGYAETIYFIQDEDSSYSGINQSSADALDMYFNNRDLRKVVFRSAVTGTIWPISQRNPKEMRLQNFSWEEKRRPKSKSDLFK